MTGVIATLPKFQFSANGVPLVSGTLTVYLAGTTTPTDTWQDAALTTLNTNPVVLDSSGSCVLWLNGALSYKFVLKNAGGVTQWTTDNISGADAHLRSDLAASSGASLVGFDPTLNYVGRTLGAAAYDTAINVKMFPWLATAGGVADDTAAIQAAINWMETRGGGTLKMPFGQYLVTGLTVPATVYLEGDGERATSLLYNGSGNAVLLGGSAGSLYYHLGIKNMRILLTHVSATAVLAKGTCGAKIHDLYIEGPLVYPRTTWGVTLDGGNASSFFNDIRNVQCNHIHTGFLVTSTGSQLATNQYFTNCTNIGDVADDASSVCLLIDTSNGNGSVWAGGNAEACGRGFYYATSAGSVAVYGARLEGNTYDIYFNLTPNAQAFFGLINLDQAKIYDLSGTGWDKHTFVGCIDVAQGNQNAPYNVWPGTQQFKSLGAAVTPLKNIAYPTQSANFQESKTSDGTVVSGVNADMNLFGNHFKFPAVQVPSADVNALDDYEEGTWNPILYSGATDATMGASTSGSYTKIGRVVHIQAYVQTTTLNGISGGTLKIKGLPFTVNSGYPGYGGGVANWAGNLNITAGHSVSLRPEATASTIAVLTWGSTTGTADMTGAEWSDDGFIAFSMTYFV